VSLRQRLARALWEILFRRVAIQRAPDFMVGGVDDPYLCRWHLLGSKPRAPGGKAISRSILGLAYPYLHCFRRSDDDRALHDHPAASISLILWGSCVEIYARPDGSHHARTLRAGDFVLRSATMAHRIIIAPGADCWTLFVFGYRWREWGFHCPNGWIPWQRFTKAGAPGEIGPGCE
jgi:hypothetical protein